jgi:assimilatory nitrate reductase electron transfer subunit
VFTCICRAVTDKQIRAAIVLGASTVDAVARETRASTGCGGCRGKIQDMIDGRCPLGAAAGTAGPAGSPVRGAVSVRVAECAVTSRYLSS